MKCHEINLGVRANNETIAPETQKNYIKIITEANSVTKDFKMETSPNCKDLKKPHGKAYNRRNVYKAIIRRMLSHINKNKEYVITILEGSGFNRNEINVAFKYIFELNHLHKQKGNLKRPQKTINSILKERCIHTYILKETLSFMIKDWESGHNGKVTRKNVIFYKEVCESYYSQCMKLLS